MCFLFPIQWFLIILVILLVFQCGGGDNFSDWKQRVLLNLGCMDIILALCEDELPIPTESSMQSQKDAYEKWERSNHF